MNIHELMTSLSQDRPIFHSEADFQHAFAWKIRTLDPNCRVRLEVPFRDYNLDRNYNLDLWLPDSRTALELKFAKHKFTVPIEDEEYCLPTGPWDASAHRFMQDINRLESLVASGDITAGFAVLLSNNPNIWTSGKRPNKFDEFRLSPNKSPLKDEYQVGNPTPGIKNVYPAVKLSGEYPLCWREYKNFKKENLEGEGSKLFRYLVVKI